MKRMLTLSSLVVILVLKSSQLKGVLSGNAYEMMTSSRPETKTEQMLPASSGLFSPAVGTSQMPSPMAEAFGQADVQQMQPGPAEMQTITTWDLASLGGRLSYSTRKQCRMGI